MHCVAGRGGGGGVCLVLLETICILQEFDTLYPTGLRTYKIARPTPKKNLGREGAWDRQNLAAKSLYRSIFRWRHFALLSISLTFYDLYILSVKFIVHWTFGWRKRKVEPGGGGQRPNSGTKSRQKSWEFSSFLFTVTCLDFYFFKLTRFYSSLLYTVKKKGGNPNRKPYTLPYGLGNPQKPHVWELSRLCPETSMNLYVHEFGFWSASEEPADFHSLRSYDTW